MWRRLAPVVLAVVIASGSWFTVERAVIQPNEIYAYSLLIDAGLYDDLASKLVESGSPGEVPPSEPPGYVAFLAAIFRAGYSYKAIKLVQCVLLALTALLSALVVQRLVGTLEALLVATVVATSPLLSAYAATLQYEILAAFLSMVVTSMVVLMPRMERPWTRVAYAIVLGLMCAVAALVREVLLILMPVALIVLLQRLGGRRSRQTGIAIACVAAWALPIGTWTIVQHAESGRYVLISSKSPINFRIGNNPAANGT